MEFLTDQTLTFANAEVFIRLDFAAPVAGILSPYVDLQTDGTGGILSATYLAGESVQVTFPVDRTSPIDVQVTAR